MEPKKQIECEVCCNGTLATETYRGENLCAECATESRRGDREYLIRQMSVQKVYTKFWSWKRLSDDRKVDDFGDGDLRVRPNKPDYIAALKENFLGNPRYDQAVVEEHIARVEKKLKAKVTKERAATKTDIDKLGEEVAAQIKGAEADNAKIALGLRQVWEALEAKQEVNGVKSKSAWAEKFGVTLRYCQYIVKDGSRKRTRKDDHAHEPRVRIIELKQGMVVSIDSVKYRIPLGQHGYVALEKGKRWIHGGKTFANLHLCMEVVEPQPKKTEKIKKEPRAKVVHAGHDALESTACGIRGPAVLVDDNDVTCKTCLKARGAKNGFASRHKKAMEAARTTPPSKRELVVRIEAKLVHVDGDYRVLEYPESMFEDARKLDLLRGVPEHFSYEENDPEKPHTVFYYVAGIGDSPMGAFTSLNDAKEWIEEEKKHDARIAAEEKAEEDKLHIKLTKLEADIVGDILEGGSFQDDALMDNMEEHRDGMDDAAFEAWLSENWINVAHIDGTTLVVDRSKPFWRELLGSFLGEQGELANMWDISDDAAKNNDDRRAVAARCACENLVDKFKEALTRAEPSQATLVVKDECRPEETV